MTEPYYGSTLARERRYYRHMAIVSDLEAMYARQAWTHSMDRICESQAEIRVLQFETRVLQQQRQDDHDMWTRAIGRIQTLEIARDPEHPDRLGDAGLAQWFEKIESVFHISKYTVECQVKFATCTLLGGALTWWNSYVRTVGHDAAYALPWKTLMKMMTENYYPRNLVVKGTDIESYTQRFQEIILLCSRMVLDESDKVEKLLGFMV
ncbi:reverse transcriptase domain-containing protein [Tanacetum coccineum]